MSRLLRERHDELIVHTGQHYDDELSRVFFDELGVPAPDHQLRRRRRHEHRADGAHPRRARADPGRAGARARARLRRHQLHAGRARSPRRRPASRSAHVEAGMRSFDRSMPEELNRVLADHASDLLLCSTDTAVGNLEREGVRGEAHLVGDVMADVSLAFQDSRASAREPRPARARAGRLPARHRPPRGQRGPPGAPASAGGAARGAARARWCFPVHPRTRRRLEEEGLLDRLAGIQAGAGAAARLSRLPGARPQRARGAHRLRRRAEGGLSARRALRDPPRHHRVGRDRGRRLERARGPGPRRGAGRARAPAARGAARAVRRRARRGARSRRGRRPTLQRL